MENEDNLMLPVNTYWGEMIESGNIDWDYREVKPYWISRICSCPAGTTDVGLIERCIRKFATATLFNRRTGRRTRYEVLGISVVDGNDYRFFQNGKYYFIIRFGNRI